MITIILLLLTLILLISNYYVHYHGRKGRLINLIPGPSEEQWKLLVTITDEFYPILKIWLFFFPIISVRHPNDLETILSSTKHIEKSLLYDVFHPWLGTGLLTSGETAMGTSLRGLGDFQQQYREAVHKMGELLTYRVMRQWLHSDWIFSLTSKGREQKKLLKILHGFTKRIIAERKLYHDRTNGQYLKSFDNDTSAKRDDGEPVGIRRKRLAMLDLLIAASRDGFMTDLDIREEVDTFMLEDRVRNEVDTALRENEQKYTIKLLQDLSYLERCIKEALRLYPSVYMLSRITAEDSHIWYLLEHSCILTFTESTEILIFGQRFAMLEMKAMIAPLIHNFYLEPIDYLKNLRIQVDLVLSSAQPLRVKFIPVCKTNASL
ncbi:Cytochrome P450 4C1 [Temnothorax longispinosus]|uniref:Cytochrome P450 4C1 n=1 Tax=Temnothorax longispinosus TaxID=300112 RepID=A0A4S2JU76_9HYME|nr:Cytochrome P450 4C1 [Temnothorax longispinosus]